MGWREWCPSGHWERERSFSALAMDEEIGERGVREGDGERRRGNGREEEQRGSGRRSKKGTRKRKNGTSQNHSESRRELGREPAVRIVTDWEINGVNTIKD